jgi:L-lactate dehydrogenase complex protein LldG
MNSRDKILSAIATNQPDLVAPPAINIDTVISYGDNYSQFKKVLESIGGKVELLSDISELYNQIIADKSSEKLVINMLDASDNEKVSLTSFELEKLEKVYLKATLGVAENGAVWLYESQMGNRLLPFICQHLILVIHKKDIVPTMHHAYKNIDIAKEGFGIFIAGPSKTADIEQSLVIGAHGSRTATIYVLE